MFQNQYDIKSYMGIKSCNCFIGLDSRNIKTCIKPRNVMKLLPLLTPPWNPHHSAFYEKYVWTLKISSFITKYKEHEKTMYSGVRSLKCILRCFLCERNVHIFKGEIFNMYLETSSHWEDEKKPCKTMNSNMRSLIILTYKKQNTEIYIF